MVGHVQVQSCSGAAEQIVHFAGVRCVAEKIGPLGLACGCHASVYETVSGRCYGAGMSEATCAALAAIFPLYALAIVAERRTTHIRIRSLKLYRAFSIVVLVTAILGTGYALIGLNLGGLGGSWSIGLWGYLVVCLLGLGYTLIGSLATAQLEEDNKGTRKRARAIRAHRAGAARGRTRSAA